MCAKSLWAVPLAAALGLVGPLSLSAQDSTRIGVAEQIRTITSRIKSAEDRQQAEKALRHLDAATVLEMILPELERLEADPETAGQFGKYLTPEEESSQPLQGYRILQGLWSDLIYEKSPNRGALLLKLLKTAQTDNGRCRVIYSLWRHFIPEAEAPLAAILRGKKTGAWYQSAAVLLHHRPEKYGPFMLDHLENEKESLNWRVALIRDFGVDSFKRMEEKDRKRFVRSAFTLIEADRRAHPDHKSAGYFPAVWIQDYLKVKWPRPSPTDPKYRSPDGGTLNDAFFEDTALSALAWWSIHRKDYE